MALDASQRKASATVDSVKARLASLTTRERQIMELVLAGKFNKVIADELNISMRTVEVHRANFSTKCRSRQRSSWPICLKAGADASLGSIFR
jgi:two-component system response regulator DctR